jgi:prepilin-type N-terminal cleavage/methylation domain-containing protein
LFWYNKEMKKIHKMSRGFTLIELLVVIAIIGILSSVVLASLNSARGKGADSAIKANLASIRAQAEIQYDNSGDYGTTFAVADCTGAGGTTLFGNTVVANQIAGAKTNGGGLTACLSVGATNATSWAVAVQYKSDLTKAYCSDSSGASKQMDNGAIAYDQGALNADITGGACGN